MSCYFPTELDKSADDAIAHVTEKVKDGGFGALTTIDVQARLKQNLDADFRPYTILGACNPSLPHGAVRRRSGWGLWRGATRLQGPGAYSYVRRGVTSNGIG